MGKGFYNVMPQMRFIHNRQNKLGKDGTASVACEVLYRRKRKWVITGVKVAPKDWDATRQRVKNRLDMLELNERLDIISRRMNEMFMTLMRNDIEFSFDFVRLVMEGRDVESILVGESPERCKNMNFVDWCIECIEKDTGSRKGTIANWRTVMSKLTLYNDSVNRDHQLRFFGDLKKENVKTWSEWLINEQEMTESSANIYIYTMGMFCKMAVENRMLANNPCEGIKLRGKKRRETIRYILQEDIEKIEKVDNCERVNRARDCFLFQCYTGMAYVDARKFSIDECQNRDGKLFYQSRRTKTGELFQIVLLPKAKEILEKYNGKLHWEYPSEYNNALKVIQSITGIKTKLSSHVGRHSFAMMCLNNGVRLEILAKMMGHSRIETTQIYAQVLGKTVEDAFAELEKKL